MNTWGLCGGATHIFAALAAPPDDIRHHLARRDVHWMHSTELHPKADPTEPLLTPPGKVDLGNFQAEEVLSRTACNALTLPLLGVRTAACRVST